MMSGISGTKIKASIAPKKMKPAIVMFMFLQL